MTSLYINCQYESSESLYGLSASGKADASADLYSVEKLLQQAETFWQEDHDTDETNHLSYLTILKIDLARATASQAASKRPFEELNAKKDQIRLKARKAEIEKLKYIGIYSK